MAGAMTTEQFKNYVFNVNKILKALNCSVSTVEKKYQDFPINRITLLKHLQAHNEGKSIRADSAHLASLGKFYNKYFDPKLSDVLEIGQKKLQKITRSEECTDIARYIGDYTLYYLSKHYEGEIHGGILKIFSHEEEIRAWMVIGLQRERSFRSKALLDVFNQPNEEQALATFSSYKARLTTQKQKRCYFYCGQVSVINPFTVQITFQGTGHRDTHNQTFFLNVKKSPQAKSSEQKGKEKRYMGGMALVLATPNDDHPQIRTYRVGISSIQLRLNDSRIKSLLRLSESKFGSANITVEDDLAFYDIVIDYEDKIEELKTASALG